MTLTLCDVLKACITADTIVHIESNLNNLVLHCKSKDDDLGNVTRNSGEEFDIHFCADFWGRSVFSCEFYWESKHQEFTVYESKHPEYCAKKDDYGFYNTDCYWKIQEDGFYYPQYFEPEPNTWLKKYEWE
uniref:self-incompatibility protein S1-like n=1 Tax=Erigeron canadensis TaxID=72917 RepID=UPI001CB9422F|nr:self-incompatibility protein S1-like [Erigeron canadensis]